MDFKQYFLSKNRVFSIASRPPKEAHYGPRIFLRFDYKTTNKDELRSAKFIRDRLNMLSTWGGYDKTFIMSGDHLIHGWEFSTDDNAHNFCEALKILHMYGYTEASLFPTELEEVPSSKAS